eukprot:CAMPEP_0196775722 /NCGR_PEP_ID=MMETSP1104-20130614/4197_1 /TAXON_ID=33652 /ORGANISM="Cafeteria sp., Strain Caron Lab Isolate" /LENGTH=482 /DNA_ID=CAMNT_0042145893 /DNA_START=6 /DNA_END=1451 /DNA_ORIENTATION=-
MSTEVTTVEAFTLSDEEDSGSEEYDMHGRDGWASRPSRGAEHKTMERVEALPPAFDVDVESDGDSDEEMPLNTVQALDEVPARQPVEETEGKDADAGRSAAAEAKMAEPERATVESAEAEEEGKANSSPSGKRRTKAMHSPVYSERSLARDHFTFDDPSSSAEAARDDRATDVSRRDSDADESAEPLPSAYAGVELATRFEVSSAALVQEPRSIVQCVIVRNRKGLNRLYPQYNMYLQEGDREILLMTAQKQKSNRTSNYHIFDMTMGTVGSKLNKKHRNYMGKLRSTFRRHECILYGPGEAPSARADADPSGVRAELAAVVFKKSSVMSQITEGAQPRKMSVALPLVSEHGTPSPFRPHSNDDSMLTRLQKEERLEPFVRFVSTDPVLQDGTYRLNFFSRVTAASVKNFQLQFEGTRAGATGECAAQYLDEYRRTYEKYCPDGTRGARRGIYRSQTVVMQFGKVSEHRFHLDFRAPINPVQ